MKNTVFSVCTVFAAAAFAAGTPRVTGVSLSCDAETGLVKIGYTLADAPGVVTFDVQTNVAGDVWASVGGKALAGAWGDVNAYVEGVDAEHEIFWQPQVSCPGFDVSERSFRAVVTAWPEEAPPDYMVIDLNCTTPSGASLLSGHSFYPNADQIPGGVTSREYKTDKLVMRKIPVSPTLKWAMGRTSTLHYVTLTNNFYMGVFEVTYSQWENLCKGMPYLAVLSVYTNFADVAVLPVGGISYTEVRGSSSGAKWGTSDVAHWRDVDQSYTKGGVEVPTPIYRLRQRTGILFDLPTEAQWEYACRAGVPQDFNNGGSTQADCEEVGWISSNSETSTIYGIVGKYPHPVGLKKPNNWGLYDMHGNVSEICLDFWVENADIGTSEAVEPAGGTSGSNRDGRGGSCGSAYSTSTAAYRSKQSTTGHNVAIGFRVVCPYPLNLKW